eukprot:1771234-Amphidinium_carterae.1
MCGCNMLFRAGFVAKQVITFSGCSLHSLKGMDAAARRSASACSWVSPFTSSTALRMSLMVSGLV